MCTCGGDATADAWWHRLDGMDASVAERSGDRNILFMHVDPHAIAFTPDFEITLKPSNEPSPFDQNSELDQHLAGIDCGWRQTAECTFATTGAGRERHWQMPTGTGDARSGEHHGTV